MRSGWIVGYTEVTSPLDWFWEVGLWGSNQPFEPTQVSVNESIGDFA
jgi:hypothetical protein